MLDTSLNGVSFTRPPIVRREASNTKSLKFESYSDLFDSSDNVVINSLNPIHQIFTVNPDNYPSGTFLTDVTLFFDEQTENETPISISIRPTVNGIPSKSIIIPFSEVTRTATPASLDLTDNTVSNGSRFTFSTPVYLPPGDYSLAIQTNDLSVEIFTNVTDVERAEFGPLYLPENNGSNVAYNDRRICVEMRSAAFGTDAGGGQILNPSVSLPLLNTNFTTDLLYISNSEENNSIFNNTVSLVAGSSSKTLRQNGSTETGRSTVLNGSLQFDMQFTGNYSTVVDVDQVSALSAAVQITDAGSYSGNETSGELALVDGNDLGAPAVARYYSKIVDISEREAADSLAVYVDGVFSQANQVQVFAKVLGTKTGNIETERYYQLYPDGDTREQSPVGTASTLFEVFDPNLGDPDAEGSAPPAPASGNFPSNVRFTQYLIKVIFNGELKEGDSIPYIDSLSALPLRQNIGILNFARAIPPGSILAYGNETAPNGFLPCNGEVYEQDGQYSNLYQAIGTRYNDGLEGPNQFRVPNLNARIPVGLGTLDGRSRNIGSTGGSHRLQGHRHHLLSEFGTAGTVSRTFSGDGAEGPFNRTIAPNRTGDGEKSYRLGSAEGNPEATKAISGNPINSTDYTLLGGEDLTEQMPPFQVVNYIVKY